jgi:signal transduction histidine kinase/CheY-like chemotaxis protein
MPFGLKRRDFHGKLTAAPVADAPVEFDPVLLGLTQLVARTFAVPTSLITLVDDHFVRLKAAIGWEGPTRMPRGNTYCEQVLTSGQPLVIQDEQGRLGGIQFYAGYPLRTAEGQLIGSINAIDFVPRDSTPAQLESLALLAAQASARIESLRLESELRALRKSFSTLAHEVRTPLNGILGATDLLQREVTTPQQIEILDALRGSGQILLQLLNDSLEASRSGAQALRIHARPFSLENLLQLLIRNFQPLAATNQLRLSFTFDSGIPSTILGDQLRFSQILQNLIGNSLKFTPPGGAIEVAAHRGDTPGSLRLTVRDNGPGIDSKLLDRIFEPYIQGPSSQFRNFEGTGLGLGIAREIARAIGGDIELTSEPGKGTLASVHLPLKSLPSLSPGTRILVVDDDSVNQFVARRLLELLDCEVQTAANGAAALQLIENHEFEAILMDCMMPVMDGYEATRRIRSRVEYPWHKIPIIALSGNYSELDRQLSLICGMDAVLVKPLELNALHDALRLALQPEWLKEETPNERSTGALASSDEGDERCGL